MTLRKIELERVLQKYQVNGAPDWIRTSNRRFRRPVPYPVGPRVLNEGSIILKNALDLNLFSKIAQSNCLFGHLAGHFVGKWQVFVGVRILISLIRWVGDKLNWRKYLGISMEVCCQRRHM